MWRTADVIVLHHVPDDETQSYPPDFLEEAREGRRRGRRSSRYLKDEMEARVEDKFCTTQQEAFGITTWTTAPQAFKKLSESAKLTMTMEMHMDAPYVTDSENVLRHALDTLEHRDSEDEASDNVWKLRFSSAALSSQRHSRQLDGRIRFLVTTNAT